MWNKITARQVTWQLLMLKHSEEAPSLSQNERTSSCWKLVRAEIVLGVTVLTSRIMNLLESTEI